MHMLVNYNVNLTIYGTSTALQAGLTAYSGWCFAGFGICDQATVSSTEPAATL